MRLNPFTRGPRRGSRSRKPSVLTTEQLEKRHALAVVLSMQGPGESVGEGSPAQFTLKLSEASKVPQRVAITTKAGSATLGSDYYAPAKQFVVFSPGQTSQAFSISTLRDAGGDKLEGNETFTVYATPDDPKIGKTLSREVVVTDVAGRGGYGVPGSNFQITFTYDSTVSTDIKSKLKEAADRWSRVIVGDLPDVTYQGRTIDDIEIAVTVSPESTLPAGVIAGANYDQRRTGATGLPFHGNMVISEAYVTAPGIMNVLTHEIGHSLGFGSLWRQESSFAPLVTGIGTANPTYVGVNGLREYRSVFQTTAANVPLYEQSSLRPAGYDGSYGSHWRDSVFNPASGAYYELMTSAYDVTGLINNAPIPAVLSRVTVGAMQDLGYQVSYARAETFPPTSNLRNSVRDTAAAGVSGGRNMLWSVSSITSSATGSGQAAAGSQGAASGQRASAAGDAKPCPARSETPVVRPVIAGSSTREQRPLTVTARRTAATPVVTSAVSPRPAMAAPRLHPVS